MDATEYSDDVRVPPGTPVTVVYIGALAATAIIVWQITSDGEATVFEGVALVALFVILATVAAYEA